MNRPVVRWLPVLALLAGTAWAAPVIEPDTRLTLKARSALADDSQLKECNIGVHVKNHVATLWGTAPSADLAQRASDNIRRVRAIVRVEDNIVVEAPDDPLVQFLKTPRLTPVFGQVLSPTRSTQASPLLDDPIERGHALMSRPERPAGGWWQPADKLTPLMPMIRMPGKSARVGQLASGGLANLPRDVEDLRRRDPRLGSLRIEVTGGVVRFHGRVSDWAAVHQFSRRVSRLPGVERVVLPPN